MPQGFVGSRSDNDYKGNGGFSKCYEVLYSLLLAADQPLGNYHRYIATLLPALTTLQVTTLP